MIAPAGVRLNGGRPLFCMMFFFLIQISPKNKNKYLLFCKLAHIICQEIE